MGEFQGDGATDSTTGSSDNGNLIGELAHKVFVMLNCEGW